ncbi:MAG: glycosyltransferase family 25 protein [Chlamydiia bacterium]|nr:glycosyltransferase family 25 protein [Chlamydiia bacterium]
MRSLILVVCLVFGQLQGTLVQHLKKIDKKKDHSWENIDFVYMINLKHRPEKWVSSKEQLDPYKIRPYRFEAINGKFIPFKIVNSLGVSYQPWMSNEGQGRHFSLNGSVVEKVNVKGRNYFCEGMTKSALGCALSHLSILHDAYSVGYPLIWVMEDDIEVLRDPRLLPELIHRLDTLVGRKNWDLLYTDRDTKNRLGEYVPCTGYAWRPDYMPKTREEFGREKVVSQDFRKVRARFGNYSIIYNRSGVKKVLTFFQRYGIFHPIDIDMFMLDNLNAYTVTEDIVSTKIDAISDNQQSSEINRE